MEHEHRPVAPAPAADVAPTPGAAPDATEQNTLGNGAIADRLRTLGEQGQEDREGAAAGFLGVMAAEDASAAERGAAAYDRGVMLERLGDLPGAVLAYEEAWASDAAGQGAVAAGEALDRLRPRVGVMSSRQARVDTQGAADLFLAGRYAEAIEVWEFEQVHTRGNEPTIQYNLAIAYAEVGRTQEAIATLAMLQDHRGIPSDVRRNAEALLQRLRGGHTPEPEVDPQVVPADPAAFDAMLDRATDAGHRGRPGEAISLYLTLVESPAIGAHRGVVWFNLGQSWADLGILPRAREAWQAALDSHQLDPDSEAHVVAQLRQVGGAPPRS